MADNVVRGKRVLLVDDEPFVRNATAMLLGVDAHEVTEAENGVQALELFQRNRFDLVITDYQMPEMKGDELAARIRQLAPAQPIIMITAYHERLGDPSVPVAAILAKPFAFDLLRRTIAQAVATASPSAAQ
jgi:CheY-like chemotaxis protein